MTMPLGRVEAPVRRSSHTVLAVTPALTGRNRLTCAFRPILAIPHILIVGAPTAFGLSLVRSIADGPDVQWSAGTGVLGLVASVCALIAWFSILFTGVYPAGLWDLAALYLRWRVRAIAYMAMLRDEYPPFGDADYPVHVAVFLPNQARNRLSTAFRVFLLVPHFLLLWALSALWLLTSIVAWFAILFTGNFPEVLYDYGVSVLRWSVRVEAYLLLLHDEYPLFSLE